MTSISNKCESIVCKFNFLLSGDYKARQDWFRIMGAEGFAKTDRGWETKMWVLFAVVGRIARELTLGWALAC